MKTFYILLLTLPLLSHSYPAPVTEEKSTSLEEEVDSEHAESSDLDGHIQKRSGGSFDYVTHLKSGLLSSIGQASASIASGSSGGSSGSYKSHDSGHHGNSVDYDPWSFKKSVLNTIFQAVKAITGGVTALKGQLIKGSGYALSASGGIVAASGDKVTDVGKAIINSAQLNSHSYGYGHSGGGGGGGSSHPFAKLSSLLGASSSSSSGSKHTQPGPVLHTETITTYEIPPSGHGSYGPPSKPPSYSSATHQYLPPAAPSYSGGGAGFSGGHAAFEAPQSNYLQTGYGHDGQDDFNIYGRHKKLTDEEARKAAHQLQEILNLLPDGKTEYTASKTVTLDTSDTPTGPGEFNHEHVDLSSYDLPKGLGPLESLSHTESITAAYGSRPQEGPADIYHQMAKKQSPEEAYINKHPNEGYDYQPPKQPDNAGYKYNNYHASGGTDNVLQDLTPIIAALEVAKRRAPSQSIAQTQYAVEKNIYKGPKSSHQSASQTIPHSVSHSMPHSGPHNGPHSGTHNGPHSGPHSVSYSGPHNGPPPPPHVPTGTGQFNYLPPLTHKTKYTYFNPADSQSGSSYQSEYPGVAYKVRRHAPSMFAPSILTPPRRSYPLFKAHDYDLQDPLLCNRVMAL